MYPLDETVFPPDIVAPTFRWKDKQAKAGRWLITVEFPDGKDRMTFFSDVMEWTPTEQQWRAMKRRSREAQARVAIAGLERHRSESVGSSREARSTASITFSTSKDEVGAPLFYREVNLPFIDAVKDPTGIRWRFGEVSSRQPSIVLEGLPVCGNCHSFSADGAVLGMDVDYANDKGSYAIVPVAEKMTLAKGNIITWSDYERQDGRHTFGLLSQISPDGRYVVSTVKDRSVFVPKPGLEFSQLFFPIRGILAVYRRETGGLSALPGADDPHFVQSNPTWSPDGKTIVFARSRAHPLRIVGDKVLLTERECREFLQDGKTFLFDLYRMPFNDGRGGRAEPLVGASNNGMSNYFPKYSPDGKWIVFCKASTFMLLQPDSELYIMPAEGGEPRRMRCNTSRMNSWHSWSPNGRWLVFSSKANGPYTQLFLAHVDEHGRSSPPVLLSHLTAPDRAANIPEFVNAAPGAIKRIHEQFLDDESFRRAAYQFAMAGDLENAAREYRKALAINPGHADAHIELGRILFRQQALEEAEGHFVKAVQCRPDNVNARSNLGNLLARRRRFLEAAEQYRQALRLEPKWTHRVSLGLALLQSGKRDEGLAQLAEAVRLDPDNPDPRYNLARALLQQGRPTQALVHYRHVLKHKPDHLPTLGAMASILAATDDPKTRNGAEAVRLATRACELTRYKVAAFLDGLAAAYAETGRFPEAVKAAEKALQLARDRRENDLAQRIAHRLELFRRGRPARLPSGPSH